MISELLIKVSIRPEFFGTVPNFEGLSRKKYEVIRDAELSRILNSVPNLSRFNIKMRCSSSSWSKCSWSFWRFCLSVMCSVELKMHKIHFRSAWTVLGELRTLPIDHIPFPSTRLRRFKKCPEFPSQTYGHLRWKHVFFLLPAVWFSANTHLLTCNTAGHHWINLWHTEVRLLRLLREDDYWLSWANNGLKHTATQLQEHV